MNFGTIVLGPNIWSEQYRTPIVTLRDRNLLLGKRLIFEISWNFYSFPPGITSDKIAWRSNRNRRMTIFWSRLQAGDEDAFLALYRLHQGPIFRFALHVTGSAALAEDIVQEVFLALIRGDLGYRPERGSLGCYLLGVARKLALRHLDGNRRNVALDGDLEEVLAADLAVNRDPLADLTRREGLEALRKAVRPCRGGIAR